MGMGIPHKLQGTPKKFQEPQHPPPPQQGDFFDSSSAGMQQLSVWDLFLNHDDASTAYAHPTPART